MNIIKAKNKLIDMLRLIDDLIYERVGPIRILFVATDSYGFSCQAPVISVLKENPDILIRVTTIYSKLHTDVNCLGDTEQKLFHKYIISKKIAAFSKWHIVIYSHLCSFYPRRHALLAYMHHGPGFGSGGGTHAAEVCDIYFGLSAEEKFYIEDKCPKLFGDSKAFFPVGFPKSDALYDGTYNRKDLLSQYGLQDRKTILIASGWRPYGLLRTLVGGPLDILASNYPDWNIIQTGHPWLWEVRDDIDKNWQSTFIDALKAIERRYPNAYFLPGVPAEPLVAASDLLVVDYSSVLTMFSLLDRPIVYFDNIDVKEEVRAQWKVYRDASYNFTSLGDLTEACRMAVKDASPKQRKARRTLKEKFFANPGCSSSAMANLLSSVGRTCTKESPGWARIINLSRKYASGKGL